MIPEGLDRPSLGETLWHLEVCLKVPENHLGAQRPEGQAEEA